MLFSLNGCKKNVISGERYSNNNNYFIGNKTYDERINKLVINWYVGNVEIIIGDEIKIQENSVDLPDKKRVHSCIDDGVLKVQFWESGLKSVVDSNQKKLTITIPEGVDIDCDLISASLVASNLASKELEIDSVSGIIKLGDLTSEDIDISSISGSIIVNSINVKNNVNISSVSSSIIVDSVKAKDIDVSSTSGKIEINNANCNKVELSTISGGIKVLKLQCDNSYISSTSGKINLGLLNGKNIEIKSVSSDIEILISDNLGMTLDYKTKSGVLDIKNSDLQFRIDNKKYIIGDGDCMVDINTTSGDILLK